MASSLPRWRRVAAISYGYIGRSTSRLSSDSASRLLIFRRAVFRSLAIPHLLVSESSYPRTRYKVLVDESRHDRAPPATLYSERSAVSLALARPGRGGARPRFYARTRRQLEPY